MAHDPMVLSIGNFARLGQVTPRMLRHYDQLGLLRPARIDDATGYRSYDIGQLPVLHRLVALRDLGFSLEQAAEMLQEGVSTSQLRDALRLQLVQVEGRVAQEQARLRRVEAHLLALERGSDGDPINVVPKRTEVVRVAYGRHVAPGFGPDVLAASFHAIVPRVVSHLSDAGVRGGTFIAWYEQDGWDDDVIVRAGFDIGDSELIANDGVEVEELPAADVASVLHRGPITGIVPVYDSLLRWIDDSGLTLAGRSREIYLQWHPEEEARNVIEIQLPVAA